jgi:hypothetical protein
MHPYCKFKVSDTVFYLIYRSPNGGADSISGMAGALGRAEKNCVIAGDFNVPEIDLANGTAAGRARELLEAAEDQLLEQMVPFPMHLRGNMLDLVLMDIPERVTDVQDDGRPGSSDHVIISFNLVIKAGAQQAHKARPDWHRADWDSMRRELARVNWDKQLSGLAT